MCSMYDSPVTTKEEPYRAAHRILALTLLEPVNLVGVTTLAHASESDGSCAMSYSASPSPKCSLPLPYVSRCQWP